ncbi:MAG: hypothetical protein LBT89_06555 [Planctomycetaceae bacterium]|jgi:hypothetical protein|nr:hypothetical protein [Planctomycetaceae bacterium]
MLELVKQEPERVDFRFLEPACGTGNFLAEILLRKLSVVEKYYAASRTEFDRCVILAVSSIYGIDILQENAEECRRRLFGIVNAVYKNAYKTDCSPECAAAVKGILQKNILWGDALTLRDSCLYS